MSSNNAEKDLDTEITGIQTGDIQRAGAKEILGVVNSIIEGMNRDIPSIDVSVREDLESLASFIQSTKREILDLRPDEISDEHLPAASVELDAIVHATEQATNSIMEAAEQIEEVGDAVGGEMAEKIVAATTQIYEACSFQDITGQRISKVVGALREIEEKIDDLLGAFGETDPSSREARREEREKERAEKRQDAVADGELLEGPQLPENAISQDDIDSLFENLG
ncbi:MAG: chemotaxis protein CheZ [Alphaproteobacteria bacterium]|nr:chemotaxis protein CheZ [Alphaproteobacteria bacterium]